MKASEREALMGALKARFEAHGLRHPGIGWAEVAERLSGQPRALKALAYYPLLVVVLLPFTLLVAASRVVLGLHYPSDVLAATAIGIALASVSLWCVSGVSLFA